jgi:hypothetical protein
MDNPLSFFAAQALTSRASVIDSLKDAMGQAVQTITAADKGITAISALIEQAKGIAQSALRAKPGTTFATGAITLSGLSAGSSAGYATVTIALTGVVEDDLILLRDKVGQWYHFTAKTTPTSERQFQLVALDMKVSAKNLADTINDFDFSSDTWGYEATYNAGTNTLTVAKYDISTGLQMNIEADDLDSGKLGGPSASFSEAINPGAAAVDPDVIEIGDVSFTATTGATAGQNFNVNGDNTADMEALALAINDYAWGNTTFRPPCALMTEHTSEKLRESHSP